MDPNILEKVVRAGALFIGLSLICLGFWYYDPRITAIIAGFGLLSLGKGWL
jgi:hypothetical protein